MKANIKLCYNETEAKFRGVEFQYCDISATFKGEKITFDNCKFINCGIENNKRFIFVSCTHIAYKPENTTTQRVGVFRRIRALFRFKPVVDVDKPMTHKQLPGDLKNKTVEIGFYNSEDRKNET